MGDELKSISKQLEEVKIEASLGTEDKVLHPVDECNLCCICRETCVHPVRLPCSHVFCFLCIKGVAVRSNHCALCRHRIPPGFLSKPSLVNKDEIKVKLDRNGDSYEWYYEAKSGGWWLYEERPSSEIERAFREGKKNLRLQISGFSYVIDFEGYMQFREDYPSRRRKIKRDRVSVGVTKGVAGIPLLDRQEELSNASKDITTSNEQLARAEHNGSEETS